MHDDVLPDPLTVLDSYAGVGLWDAIPHNGDPAHPQSRWTWSTEFRRLLGYRTESEFPNLFSAWLNSLHPDDMSATLNAIAAAIADSAPTACFDIKYRLRSKDGTYRWYRAVGGVTHDDTGLATRACGSLIDIDDGEKAIALEAERTAAELTRLDDIGRRLRLISLNARIEAGRMGEAGAAFSVVATEISNLAAAIATSVAEFTKGSIDASP